LKYVRLFRLKTTLIYLFPFVLALSVGLEQVKYGVARPIPPSLILFSKPLWVTVLLAYLSYCSMSFFSSTLNCYVDVPADIVHDNMFKDQHISKQPFVTGEMSRLETVLTFLLTGIGCIVFPILVNLRFAVFMIGVVLVLGILYSHPWFRFKEKPVMDVLTNATAAVLLLFTGMSVMSIDFPPVQPTIFGALLAATMYLPSVANDAPFDEIAGYRTSGVVFGQKRLIQAMIPLSIALIPLGLWVVLSRNINWQYKLFDGIAVFAAIGLTTMCLLLYRPPHIELNPLIIVGPIAALDLFYIVLGIYRVVTW